MTIDITAILEAIAYLIVVIMSTIVIPYIRKKTTIEQQMEINKWVSIAVTAAEQIYVGSGRGEEKKAYVIDWLAKNNIKYNEEKIDAIIESAVYAMKNGVLV